MALGTFVAGRYSATYDPPGGTAAADVGLMEDGYDISARIAKEKIGETDAYGGSVIDAIYRGIAEVFIDALALEWKAGLLNAIMPYATLAPSGATYFGPGVIARLDSAVAGILIMTATSSTPAAAAPASLTATYTIIDESIRWGLKSKLRKMPFRWQVYPYDDSGTIKYFTAT